MFMRFRQACAVALFLAGESLVVVSPAQGDQILSWLFGESPPSSGQVVAYYGSTQTYYPGAQTVPSQVYYGGTPSASYASSCGQSTVAYRVAAPSACCEPTVVYQVPADVCNPVSVACEPPRRSCWDRLTSCFGGNAAPPAVPVYEPVPRASYRTTWKQIPVTRYRPITSADPITGCPVTVMKACTTYAWQPERQRCGFFGRLLGQCDPPPAAVNPCCPNPCMTQCVVTSDSCGCGVPSLTPSLAPTPAVPPYYAPGPATIPPSGIPGSALPTAPSTTPTLAPPAFPSPAAAPPATGVPGAAGPEPAETRPSLVPGYGDASSGVSAPQPMSSSMWGSGAATADNAVPQAATANPDAGTQTILNKTVPLPVLGNPAVEPVQPRPTPVPDPEATPTRIEEEPTAPQLLNPRDQVAVLRSDHTWAVTTITWPKTSSQGRRPMPKTTAAPRQHRGELDESGWISIAR